MRLGKVEQELAVQVHRNQELRRDHEGLVSLVDSLVTRLGAETDERVSCRCQGHSTLNTTSELRGKTPCFPLTSPTSCRRFRTFFLPVGCPGTQR